jgi:type I restriction enzyme, S subunit
LGGYPSIGRNAAFKRINISEIKALAIVVPPKPEQDAICEFLDADMGRYDTTLSRFEREIELLREYRIRLVADMVTGKLDVREAVARLAEERGKSDLSDLSELDDNADEPEPEEEQ